MKHHYIPRFLLARWAIDEGRLWRVTRPVAERIATKHVAPAEIGYERNLYAARGVAANDAQMIEQRFMSPLDAQAAEAHRILLDGGANRMSRLERSAWSRFVMAQWFRTPAGVRHFKEAYALALAAPFDGNDDGPEALDGATVDVVAMLGADGVENAALRLLMEFSDDPERGHSMNNMHWRVLETSGRRELLLSDAALQHSVAGVFTDRGWITMPIAPDRLFVATFLGELGQVIAELPRPELVRRNNRAVVRRASVFVGASDLTQLPFLERHFGAEDHLTIIGGIADRYRESAGKLP
ncbi:MAG: DUF4238 domain-containing protein [Pseudomonadota bacterium]